MQKINENIFGKLPESEQIEYLIKAKIKKNIDGDLYEVEGNIDDVCLLKNDSDELFVAVNFCKNSIWNENTRIFYDSNLEPLGKFSYSYNLRDARVSFDYFFVRKDLRGQHLGQFLIDFFYDDVEQRIQKQFDVYTNPYSFDITFNGAKGSDYITLLHQYRLEQFYLRNDFILTEEPKKYVFSNPEEEPEYILTSPPSEEKKFFYNIDKKYI